jgi:hypothetical protein
MVTRSLIGEATRNMRNMKSMRNMNTIGTMKTTTKPGGAEGLAINQDSFYERHTRRGEVLL